MSVVERQPVGFSYIRFSSKRQEKGDSVRRQTALSESWSVRSGIPLDNSLGLNDLNVSSFRGKNRHVGALGRFLALAQEGKQVRPGDYLVVEALDRLSRQTAYLALPIITELVSAGVRIVNLDLGSGRDQIIDREELTDNPHVLIFILLEFVRAHEESMKKSRRVREWRTPRLEKARASKIPLAQRVPGWIRRAGDKFELIPENTNILRRAIDMALRGMGPLSIAAAQIDTAIAAVGVAELAQEEVAALVERIKMQVARLEKIMASRAMPTAPACPAPERKFEPHAA